MSSSRLWEAVVSRWCMPDRVLDELSQTPDFLEAYRSPVGVQTAFTLRTHTLKVMDCYEKHFAQRPQTSPRGRGAFRLFLALHDIGKPRAIFAGDKRRQHGFTIGMIRETRRYFPVTDREFGDWIALEDGDPIGAYLKREISLRESAEMILRMAGQSSMTRDFFWKLLKTYYQCDASAYTRRTGLMSTLDGLFEWDATGVEIAFDEPTGLLRFSGPVRKAMAELDKKF